MRQNRRTAPLQLDSITKVRLQSIKDRWLMNSRPADYDAYIKSSFMLIQAKQDAKFAQSTQMTDLVTNDFQNFEQFLE